MKSGWRETAKPAWMSVRLGPGDLSSARWGYLGAALHRTLPLSRLTGNPNADLQVTAFNGQAFTFSSCLCAFCLKVGNNMLKSVVVRILVFNENRLWAGLSAGGVLPHAAF